MSNSLQSILAERDAYGNVIVPLRSHHIDCCISDPDPVRFHTALEAHLQEVFDIPPCYDGPTLVS